MDSTHLHHSQPQQPQRTDQAVTLNPQHFLDPQYPQLFDQLVGNVLINATDLRMANLCREYCQIIQQIAQIKTETTNKVICSIDLVQKLLRQTRATDKICNSFKHLNADVLSLQKQIHYITQYLSKSTKQAIQNFPKPQLVSLTTQKQNLKEQYQKMYSLIVQLNIDINQAQKMQQKAQNCKKKLQIQVKEIKKLNIDIRIQCKQKIKKIEKEQNILEIYRQQLYHKSQDKIFYQRAPEPIDRNLPIIIKENNKGQGIYIRFLLLLWLIFCFAGTAYIFL